MALENSSSSVLMMSLCKTPPDPLRLRTASLDSSETLRSMYLKDTVRRSSSGVSARWEYPASKVHEGASASWIANSVPKTYSMRNGPVGSELSGGLVKSKSTAKVWPCINADFRGLKFTHNGANILDGVPGTRKLQCEVFSLLPLGIA